MEAVLLSLLTIIGVSLPGRLVVPMLAFCGGLQNTSFAALGPWKFNSAMTTGNLREGTSGLWFWITGHNPQQNRGKAIVSLTVSFWFVSGAILGGLYTRSHQRYALAPCVALNVLGLVLTWRQRQLYRHRVNGSNTSGSLGSA